MALVSTTTTSSANARQSTLRLCYAAPAPVYYPRPVTYYQPQTVYMQPYQQMRPAPVYYTQPAVVYTQQPVIYRESFGNCGNRQQRVSYPNRW